MKITLDIPNTTTCAFINIKAVAKLQKYDLDWALDALPSAEPPTGELISKEDAIARIANDNVVGGMERINEYNNSTEFNEYLDGISDAITTIFCDVPSADAVQGEWIDKGNWMGIECSRCKCHSRYVTPFCPQCGARMKGGAE